MKIDRRFLQTEDRFIAEDLLQMKNATNYNAWQFSLIQPYLGKRILEIGSGIGSFTKGFLENSDFVMGVEPNKSCQALLEGTFGNESKFKLLKENIEDCDSHLLSSYSFDTIICMNVLEHIENDTQILEKFFGILNLNGNLVLLVPAIPWIYGSIDASVGHFRRYAINEVNLKLGQVGFKVMHLQYSNLLGLMGWSFNSKIKKSTKQNDSQIRLFDKMVPILRRMEKKHRPPVGLSIIAVGKKLDDRT